MEALEAVSLAGNVVQFAFSAGTLIKEANQIRKSGTPSSLRKLRDLSGGVVKASESFQCNIGRRRSGRRAIYHHAFVGRSQNLLDLASECQQAGKEFIAYLNGLISSFSSFTTLRTFKTANKFQWASYKIDDFVSTLDRLRSSLNLKTTA
jgi:hypothetical protein